jgi:hypothetical protein
MFRSARIWLQYLSMIESMVLSRWVYDIVLYRTVRPRDVFAFHQWRIGSPRLRRLETQGTRMSPFGWLTAGDNAVSESFVPLHLGA